MTEEEAVRLLKASGDYALDTDYGDAIRAIVDALEARPAEYEYSPGHYWLDRDGGEHWFVGNGVIKPSYVSTYLDQGGDVIRRKVGKWETIGGEQINDIEQ